MEKVAIIITVRNEINTIQSLLDSIQSQTVMPNEVVIVDANSTDGTSEYIKHYVSIHKQMHITHIRQSCRRSEGRNIAIRHTTSEIIAITDAGCILDKYWLERIVKPFKQQEIGCVAGYYDYDKHISPFAESMTAFMLVLPKKINPKEFLPATRSMAIRKTVWQTAGGFPENLYSSEDYVFAQKLKQLKVPMKFVSNAIVYWQPPTSFAEFIRKIYEFAYNDVKGGVIRTKMLSIFVRYAVFVLFASFHMYLFLCVFFLYLGWSMSKHRKDIRKQSLLFVPFLQISTDITVMYASLRGFLL